MLFTKAGQIVRLTAEVAKPNEKRLEEFEDSALPSLKNELFSAAPIYADLEEALLADQFAQAREALGASHPFVQAVLEGKSPEEAAHALVAGTRLQDVKVREGLVKGGTKAVLASTDPLIVLARKVDPLAREARRFRDEEVRAPTTRAEEKIAEARFKVHGRSAYPDATFSLRLSYGTVKGYPAEGTRVAPFTTFHGLFDRSLSFGGKAPWNLPARWLEKKGGARPLGAPELRLYGRHHRGELGQPGARQGRRGGGPRLRRQHRVDGLGLLLHRRAGARGGSRQPRRARSPASPVRRPGAREGAGRALT